tara:strand:+ start:1321 stop:2370 length:1050 start_codon:yes stop_codon:yes gene_type:complete
MTRNKTDWETIAKYLAGEASKEDKAYVAAWLASESTHKKSLESLKKALRVLHSGSADWDVEAAWATLSNRLGHASARKPRTSRVRIPTGGRTLWARSPVAYGLRLAVIVFLIAGVTFVAWPFLSEMRGVSSVAAAQEIVTENAQRATLKLSDGTSVRLNVASALRIADGFPDTREVFLEGEAYFEVKRDTEKPFVVHTGEVDITVLGTEFDVRAWDVDERVEVVVARGKVSVKSIGPDSQSEVILTKGQKSQVKHGNKPTPPKSVDTDNYLAWLRGELVFNDAPFLEVITQLERQYDLQIELSDSSFLSRHLTAGFGKEPVDEVLYTIALSLDLGYQRSGRSVTFSSTK